MGAASHARLTVSRIPDGPHPGAACRPGGQRAGAEPRQGVVLPGAASGGPLTLGSGIERRGGHVDLVRGLVADGSAGSPGSPDQDEEASGAEGAQPGAGGAPGCAGRGADRAGPQDAVAGHGTEVLPGAVAGQVGPQLEQAAIGPGAGPGQVLAGAAHPEPQAVRLGRGRDGLEDQPRVQVQGLQAGQPLQLRDPRLQVRQHHRADRADQPGHPVTGLVGHHVLLPPAQPDHPDDRAPADVVDRDRSAGPEPHRDTHHGGEVPLPVGPGRPEQRPVLRHCPGQRDHRGGRDHRPRRRNVGGHPVLAHQVQRPTGADPVHADDADPVPGQQLREQTGRPITLLRGPGHRVEHGSRQVLLDPGPERLPRARRPRRGGQRLVHDQLRHRSQTVAVRLGRGHHRGRDLHHPHVVLLGDRLEPGERLVQGDPVPTDQHALGLLDHRPQPARLPQPIELEPQLRHRDRHRIHTITCATHGTPPLPPGESRTGGGAGPGMRRRPTPTIPPPTPAQGAGAQQPGFRRGSGADPVVPLA